MQRPVSTMSASAAKDAGILLIEHLNFKVPCLQVATEFYAALGCQRNLYRDPKKTAHFNCGAFTQLHSPSPDTGTLVHQDGATRWPGTIELRYRDVSSLHAAAGRLRAASLSSVMTTTQLSIQSCPDTKLINTGVCEHSEKLEVVGPYGNRFVLTAEKGSPSEELDPSDGRRPGSEGCSVAGISSLVLEIPVGTAVRAARFYREILGWQVLELSPGRWTVLGGPSNCQRLVLQEVATATAQLGGTDTHIGIHIGDFENCFSRLKERGLIYVKENSPGDTVRELEDARKYQTFRFRHVVDVTSGECLFDLEHEIFSRRHKDCPLAGTETHMEAAR